MIDTLEKDICVSKKVELNLKDIQETQKFAEKHIALVRSLANRFIGRGAEYDDLFSAGCLGLMKAAKAFDESRGLQFSTYAVPVILGEIKRIFRDGGSVKVSRSLKELSLKATRTRDELFKNGNGETPRISNIAEKLGVTSEEVAEALGAAIPPISLSASYNNDEGEGGTGIDVAVAPEQETTLLKIALSQVMSVLSAEDRKLIYLRYDEDKTQTEVGKILGLSQVQVSRREKRLLEFIRKELF